MENFRGIVNKPCLTNALLGTRSFFGWKLHNNGGYLSKPFATSDFYGAYFSKAFSPGLDPGSEVGSLDPKNKSNPESETKVLIFVFDNEEDQRPAGVRTSNK